MVLFAVILLRRVCVSRESEDSGAVPDTGPVGLAVVELPAGKVGTVPVEKGRVDCALGTVPEDSGIVPVENTLVALRDNEGFEPEAAAEENDGNGIEVALAVVALPERVNEPPVALRTGTLVPPVDIGNLLVALLELGRAEQPNADALPALVLRSKALTVSSL